MKHYELTYLISPDITEEELEVFSGKINNFILEENGVLDNSTKPVRKKLGSPIKKKGEAFLITLDLSLNPENLKKLEEKLKSESQILRYLILTKKISKKPFPIRAAPKIKKLSKVSNGIMTKEPLAHQPKTEKVELKEIDKKIEEILQE